MAAKPPGSSSTVRTALQEIMADHGPAAFSEPVLMSSLLADLLPDEPRIGRILVAAAQDRVAGSLLEHLSQGMDTDTAARLVATSFARATLYSPEACAWVVGELAEALGVPAGQPTVVPHSAERTPLDGPAFSEVASSRRASVSAWTSVSRASGPSTARSQAPDEVAGDQIPRQAVRHRPSKGAVVRRSVFLLTAFATLAAAVLSAGHLVSSIQSAHSYRAVAVLSKLDEEAVILAQTLEAERDQVAVFISMSAPAGGRDALLSDHPGAAAGQLSVVNQDIAATNRAAARFSAIARSIGGSYSPQARQAARAGLAALAELRFLRRDATHSRLPVLVVVQKYAQVIDYVLALDGPVARLAVDPVLARTTRVLAVVAAMQEEASLQRAILSAALLQDVLTPADLAALQTAQSGQQSNLALFDIYASPGEQMLWNNTAFYLADSEEQQAVAIQRGAGSLRADPITQPDWYGAVSNSIDQMGSVERRLDATLTTRAESLRGSASESALAGGLILALLIALIAVVLGPSIARPRPRNHRDPGRRAPLLEVQGRGQPTRLTRRTSDMRHHRRDA